ncbi:MAG: IPTL-CTERM sorting domain-containing protein [Halioglobus sp.]
MRRNSGFLLACLFTLLAFPAAADLVNGNFETGNLTGWTTTVNGSANSVQVTSGATVTDAGTIQPSPTGDYFVFTSQSGPGSSFLTQDFVVQPGTNKIFFDLSIINAATDFYVPSPLSFDFNGAANQQARFDILVPGAAIDTVNPADIIVTGYQTQPGDPLTQNWASYEVDATAALAAYEGQTVTFRFVQVDNQSYFNLAIDNVNVGLAPPGGATPTQVPTLSQWSLYSLGLLMGILGVWRLRRQYG